MNGISKLSRREALALGATALAAAPHAARAFDKQRKDKQRKLVAHRGVVTEKIPENSAAALEEAIRRGYWMVETDLRATKDGRIVIQHDKDFERVYGVKRRVSDMTLSEIKGLRTVTGNQTPLEFREFADMARGRIGIWIDTKEPVPTQQFFTDVEAALRDNRLLDSAVIGPHATAVPWFRGKATCAASIHELFDLKSKGSSLDRWVLGEGIGFTMSSDTVRWGIENGVPVIPFIGTWHYPDRDPLAPGLAAIARLGKDGVGSFMIDAVYEKAFS